MCGLGISTLLNLVSQWECSAGLRTCVSGSSRFDPQELPTVMQSSGRYRWMGSSDSSEYANTVCSFTIHRSEQGNVCSEDESCSHWSSSCRQLRMKRAISMAMKKMTITTMTKMNPPIDEHTSWTVIIDYCYGVRNHCSKAEIQL